MSNNNKLYSDHFAYDLSNNILSKGEIFDYDVINQSIENILSETFGERLFNPYFGSSLGLQLFEGMTNDLINNNGLIKKIISEISLWENRISFIIEDCNFSASPDNNYVNLQLTYIINKTQIRNTFKRKIRI